MDLQLMDIDLQLNQILSITIHFKKRK